LPNARQTYVRVSARNRALNYLRGERIRQQATKPLSSIVSDVPSPAEARHDAKVLLASVSEPDRSLMHWRFLEGLSLKEAAHRAGLSYSAAAVRVFRT